MLHRDRLERLIEILKERELDGVFIGPSSDLKYLTELDFFPDARTKGLFVSRKGRAFFLCPVSHRHSVTDLEDVPILEWQDSEGAHGAFRRGLEGAELPSNPTLAFTKGLEAGSMLELVEGLEVRCVSGLNLLIPLRSVKSREEQAKMRHASAMCDSMMEALVGYLRPGLREREVRNFIMNFHESRGGKPRVPCVASGPNSCHSHYFGDNDRAISENDIVMIDSGGWYSGYSHDMTRTFFIGGATEKQRRVYDIVLQAQSAAEAKVRPGAVPSDLDATARRIIQDAGYGHAFPHSLGHSIGLDGQELPHLNHFNHEPLVSGNCFSVEPGIYLPGEFGVRIENIVLVTDTGYEPLNRFSKELVIL
ncbi:MAG: aminopeptidase P family protein [Fretibacterium sp.]|nr:aminopeptidase P family protein [Fretibacterium sp.]